MKKNWVLDAFLGLLLTGLAAACYLLPGVFPFLEGVELKSYDRRSQLRQSIEVSNSEIVLIAIDDNSVAQFGRWPWPRSQVAALLDKLAPARARVIGLDIDLSEPEEKTGLAELDGLRKDYDELVKARKVLDRRKEVAPLFEAARVRLDSDSKLLASLKQTGGVVLPLFFAHAAPGVKPEPLPSSLAADTVHLQAAPGAELGALPDQRLVIPLASFSESARGVGHGNIYPDQDFVVRREAPVLRYADSYIPSYPLELAAAYMGLKTDDITFIPGRQIKLGKTVIPLDSESRMAVTFNGPYQTFRYVSFQDVINDKVSLDLFRDKIVILGVTAAGASALYGTPVAANFPSPEIAANVVENILHNKFITRPPWAFNAEVGILALAGLFVMFLLPRLRTLGGFISSFLLVLAIVGGSAVLFVNGQWIKVAYPVCLVAVGWMLSIFKRLFATVKAEERVEASLEPDYLAAPLKQESKENTPAAPLKFLLGSFEIEKELSRGAAGAVYFGKDPKTGRQAIIKTAAVDETTRERLLREAKAAGALDHPNIARILDFGEGPGVVYIASEMTGGHDLSRYTVKGKLLSPMRAMEYAAAFADALDYAHAKGVVHGGVAAENLMILEDGTARIAGFGFVDGRAAAMSPEQAAGKKIDGRSDLFSLSCVLFELLTGEKPFKGEGGDGTLLFQIVNDPHPDPLKINPMLPVFAAAILNQGLAKNPSERYARAAAMASDLRTCVAAIKSETAQPRAIAIGEDPSQPTPLEPSLEEAAASLADISIPSLDVPASEGRP